ncbi:MAG: precorrin-6y C5,15-methyltransferase (decarboxylating) subunit CbiE [Fusobacteriaceae bacterium]
MKKINIVGAGPGNENYLVEEGVQAIKRSTLIIGDSRLIHSVKNLLDKQEIYLLKKFSHLLEVLKEKDEEITILVSGDTGFYSLLDFINRNISGREINVIPGIASFQYLFSKLKKCWHNYLLMSLHGRDCDYIKLLEFSHSGVVLLTDRENTPYTIGKKLTESGLGDLIVRVGENLSYENEKIYWFYAKDYDNHRDFSMNIVIIEKG